MCEAQPYTDYISTCHDFVSVERNFEIRCEPFVTLFESDYIKRKDGSEGEGCLQGVEEWNK